jgi:hypothetical protein
MKYIQLSSWLVHNYKRHRLLKKTTYCYYSSISIIDIILPNNSLITLLAGYKNLT